MLDATKIQLYPEWERTELLARLSQVVTQIFGLTQEWWQMQADECRTKSEAYMNSNAESVAGKTRDVELATYHVTSSILETRGQLESLKEERNFLLLLLAK